MTSQPKESKRRPSRHILLVSKEQVRVYFVALLPADNAATRAHCVRIAHAMEAAGIDTQVFLPSGVLLGRLRRGPLLVRGIYWYGLVLSRRLLHLLRCSRADVVVVQRSAFRYKSRPWFERWLRNLGGSRPTRVVLHIDDALYIPADRHRPVADVYDKVITGNNELAERYLSEGADVHVVPGALPVHSYKQRRHVIEGIGTVLGWMGSRPERYLPPVSEALARVCSRTGARVHIASDHQVSLPDLSGHVNQTRWSLNAEFEIPSTFDVGLMPLHDDPYDRAKEGYKIKEYMSAGIPVVCSPVGHNLELVEDGVNGYFAESAEDWEDRLIRLISDAELRSRMGEAGRSMVQRFELAEIAPAWIQIIEQLV